MNVLGLNSSDGLLTMAVRANDGALEQITTSTNNFL